MLDFLKIATRSPKRGLLEIYPKFIIKKSDDLMVRGGDFYAIWDEERGMWSTEEDTVRLLIDRELDKYAEENRAKFLEFSIKVLYMWDSDSGSMDRFHKYCQKQMRDNFHMLDEKIIFSNDPINKEDYASKRLSYPLEDGSIEAYEKLIGTLYSDEERHKLEWAIGAIVSGDSKYLQKFIVLYGEPGSGKSTILNIIQQLFDGYYSVFDAKALGSASNAFALEAFKTNPLVAIQHDGDLSRIEDNTRLNSLVSHEMMTVNEKHKSLYANRFKTFLFMGTNKPVKITDAKSGLIRRLIDVTPSGERLGIREYNKCTKQVIFELGPIAKHCLDVYKANPEYYDDYIPLHMLSASNDFYNFVLDSYIIFSREDGVTLKQAWEMYKVYVEDAKIQYPFSQRVFKEELKAYFKEYKDRHQLEDGTRVRSYYLYFRKDRFEEEKKKEEEHKGENYIQFKKQKSILDDELSDCPAQYASQKGIPQMEWDNVTNKLSDLDTSKLHYVKVPLNHIVIDFDIPGEDGEKSFEKNLEAASRFPSTYAELSKSGSGIHLHYIYSGDVTKLSRIYDEHIEIKVFNGKSSLRRMLTKCCNLPIAVISSGLPLKKEKKNMVDFDVIKSEKGLRSMIIRNLNKEFHPGTKPSIDFIIKILDDAYNSGLHYDVSDMRSAIITFAANSSHQSDYCLKAIDRMKFKSEDASNPVDEEGPIIFYDVEVFPNLFLVNWKKQGEGNSVVRMINPTPAEIEELIRFRLVGFNCRRYDNHILYARLMGYTNEQLYKLSQKIISGDKHCFFGEAYNISYTDVYDFASAGNKMSLKKLEIKMGIHHQELGLPWDQPVPEELWLKVAEYCDNDVIATEAAFNYLASDWTARQILADLAEATVNDTTNSLTQRIIFGMNRKLQSQFHYRNLAEPVRELDEDTMIFLKEVFPKMMEAPHGEAKSVLPYFPGYKYENGKSTYRDEEVGEGGYVYSEPGMYGDVALLDVTSMHPHSAMAEVIFGPEFTRRFYEIVYGRVHIKHEAWDEVNKVLNGKLTPYIQKVIDGEMTSKQLADALKTAINSVYGLTSANFDNAFRDTRNIDNIVAKRGALFMIDLKHAVQEQGFIVAHIKTDSIKIPDATPEIIDFVMEFGARYGYTFEHEATYDRMCLVNDAVYIAKYATAEKCQDMYGYVPGDNKKKGGQWTATGTQFAVPYVFKTLFSKEEIIFEDLCEVKEVKSGSIYVDMNENLPDVSALEKEYSKIRTQFRKGEISDTTYESTMTDLRPKIADGHDYHFVGRIGQFTPIKPNCGGGILVREMTDWDGSTKYNSVTGTKGYRWLESEIVRNLGKDADVDYEYYNELVTDAVHTIVSYGDFEWFVSEEPYIRPDFKDGKPVYLQEII